MRWYPSGMRRIILFSVIWINSMAWADRFDLEFTSPTAGTQVWAGQTLRGMIRAPSGKRFPRGLALFADGGLTGLGPPSVEGPPYRFAFPIPATAAPGNYHFSAMGMTTDGDVLYAAALPIVVNSTQPIPSLPSNQVTPRKSQKTR